MLHVAMNHFPVVGAVTNMITIIVGVFKKNDTIKQIALWLFSVLALIAIPVLLTGESAKEFMEHLPGIRKELIDPHEKLAKITFWLLIMTGLLSVAPLCLKSIKKRLMKLTTPITFLSIIVTGFAGLIANARDKIRHPEFSKDVNARIEDLINRGQVGDRDKTKTRKNKGRKRKGREP